MHARIRSGHAHPVLTPSIALLGLAILFAVSGCGAPGSAAPGQQPSPTTDLRGLLISAASLPARFRASTGESPAYRFTLCGVDLEPTAPVSSSSTRFARSEIGPFVEQRVRRYPDDSQRDVIAALRAALPTCASTRATDPASPGTATPFVVRTLALRQFGEDSIAWHQEVDGERPVPTDVVLMRKGRTIVLVTSYTFEAATDPQTILDAAAAAEAPLTRLP